MITTIPDRERALQAQVDALTAELARLRAVEPFGWFYDITNGDQKQGPIWQGGEDRKITEIVAEDIGAKVFPLYRAAPPAQPAEPDMRHPKIQALIGSMARCQIELQLVEQLLEDPNFETTSMDMEHWGPMHDKLKAILVAAAQPVPAQEPLTEVEIFKAYTTATGKVLPNMGSSRAELVAITRIVERAHGITGEKNDR